MNEPVDYLKLDCPGCGKRLKVPPRFGGKTVACPKCRTPVSIPGSEPAKDDLQLVEDLPEEEPAAVRRRITPTRSASAAEHEDRPPPPQSLAGDDDEYRLQGDQPVSRPAPPPARGASKDLAEEVLSEAAAAAAADEAARPVADVDALESAGFDKVDLAAVLGPTQQNPEFRFHCKVCGTPMFATEEQVGDMTRCPDCYSQFSIPQPPKHVNVVTPAHLRKPVQPRPVAGAPAVPRVERSPNQIAEDLLRQAEVELAEDVKKQKYETYDFDTQDFLSKTFGFLSDPSVYAIAAATGFLLGLVIVGSDFLSDIARSNGNEQMANIALVFPLLMLGLPLIATCLLNGLAILEATANNERRVSQWPAANIGESIAELIMLVIAAVLAVLPGAVLGWALTVVGMPQVLQIAASALSLWLLYPIIMLGMMDNQAITMPISSDVVRSLGKRADSWAAMYLLTGLATLALLLCVYLIAIGGTAVRLLISMLLPLLIFFIFRQFGNLAARIASVTNLVFEPGSDDEEADDE